MKIKIKVTKDVLKRAMWCGTNKSDNYNISSNCAISLAVRDIFPKAEVGVSDMYPLGFPGIRIIHNQSSFVLDFDRLKDTPEQRPSMPELEFEVELPDSVVDAINISDIHKSATLEVVAS